MAEAATGQHQHRGVRAVQRMVEYAPSSGGLALWVGHRDLASEPETTGAPVHTDGLTLHYAPAFAALPVELQTGWVAHEVLHIALRHAQRFDDLRRRLGDVDLQLFNRCADAVVNSALSHVRWLALPPGAIRLEAVLDEVLGEQANREAALLAWDVERLYIAVDDRRSNGNGRGTPQRQGDSRRGRGDDGLRSATPAAERHDEPASPRCDGPRAARMRTLGAPEHDDLRPDVAGAEPQDEAERAREWLERLLRAQADDGETSLLRSLLADLPRVRTPWELVLRAHAARALARRPGLSWSRPARSYLANQGRDRRGRRMPWEPGTTASRTVPRLALVIDVSGSIDDGLLQRFGREVDAIMRRQEAPLVLVAGDMQVRQVRHLQPGESTLDALQLPGGGGTDFAPLLAEAARHSPDLVVVLTDLEGPAGPAPRCPVIWAVPATHATKAVPFGRRLVLE